VRSWWSSSAKGLPRSAGTPEPEASICVHPLSTWNESSSRWSMGAIDKANLCARFSLVRSTISAACNMASMSEGWNGEPS
jgi:hypothetical protein